MRPHINLHGVRYTSSVLATSAHLIGQYPLIYLNADDLRCVRAFLSDGTELCSMNCRWALRRMSSTRSSPPLLIEQA